MRPWIMKRLRVAYVIAAAVVGALLVYRAVPASRAALAGFPWDFVQEHKLGRAFAARYDPYAPAGRARAGVAGSPTAIGHPPSTVIWFVPLVTRVDLGTAHVVIGWLSMLALLAELLALFAILRVPAAAASAWLAFAGVLSLSFFTYHLGVGQLSALIALLLVAAWAAARRGHDVLAGLALGVACTLKLFPGVIVLLYLVWRRWRVIGAAAAVYLATVAATMIWIGPASWLHWLRAQRQIADIVAGNIQNQAISGVVLRFFHPVCRPPGPETPAAVAITMALTVAIVGVGCWRAWRVRAAAATAQAHDLAFATFTVIAVVTSQWSWEHYNVLYIMPIAVSAAALVSRWRRGARAPAAAGVALLAAVLASWLIDIWTKTDYHHAYERGDTSVHVLMHLFEVLNWLPGLVLLAVTGTLLWRAGDSNGSGNGVSDRA